MLLYVVHAEVSGDIEPPMDYELRRLFDVDERNRLSDLSRHDYEYIFDYWPEDDLQTSLGCFLVSSRLRSRLLESGLSGFEIRDLRTSTSRTFEMIHGSAIPPEFKWFIPLGQLRCDESGGVSEWDGSDFAYRTKDLALVVTPPAFQVLNACSLKGAIINTIEVQ